MFAPKQILGTKATGGAYSRVLLPEPLGGSVPRLEWMTFHFMNFALSTAWDSKTQALLERYKFLRAVKRNRIHVEIQGLPSPGWPPEENYRWRYYMPATNDGSWIFLQEWTGEFPGNVPIDQLAPPDPQVLALIDTYKPLNAVYFLSQNNGFNLVRRIPEYKKQVEKWGGKFSAYFLFGLGVGDGYPLWNQWFNGCAWPDRDVVGNKTSEYFPPPQPFPPP